MEKCAKAAPLDRILAQQLHRALTAPKEELFAVLENSNMEVLGSALKNPGLDENHLLALLKRRDLSEDFLRTVYNHRAVGESHDLKVALVHNPHTPAPVALTLLQHLYLFELVTICYLPGATPDQKLAAERAIIQRLPTTSLGNKITLSRRCTTAVAAEILKEGDPRLLDACLPNPHLKEVAVFQFLSGPNGTAETISIIARHPRWQNRPNLQLAILKNPRTPAIWFTLFLPRLNSADIRAILSSRRLTGSQKKLVNEELKRRGLL